jgi:hypothetical protein
MLSRPRPIEVTVDSHDLSSIPASTSIVTSLAASTELLYISRVCNSKQVFTPTCGGRIVLYSGVVKLVAQCKASTVAAIKFLNVSVGRGQFIAPGGGGGRNLPGETRIIRGESSKTVPFQITAMLAFTARVGTNRIA